MTQTIYSKFNAGVAAAALSVTLSAPTIAQETQTNTDYTGHSFNGEYECRSNTTAKPTADNPNPAKTINKAVFRHHRSDTGIAGPGSLRLTQEVQNANNFNVGYHLNAPINIADGLIAAITYCETSIELKPSFVMAQNPDNTLTEFGFREFSCNSKDGTMYGAVSQYENEAEVLYLLDGLDPDNISTPGRKVTESVEREPANLTDASFSQKADAVHEFCQTGEVPEILQR